MLTSETTHEKEKPPKRVVPADKKALDMLEKAISDEMADAEYYGRLINMTNNPHEKAILRQIRLDELKHKDILRAIYLKLCGTEANSEPEHKPLGRNLRTELERSVFNELAGSEFYKKIYFSFLSIEVRDMLLDIFTDEQAHAIKLTQLISGSNTYF